jgi:hypothetical protein
VSSKYQIYGLEENYLEPGSYPFKIVVSPRYQNGNDFNLTIFDSHLNPVRFELKRWGRKLNVVFVIDRAVADGAAIVTVYKGDVVVGHRKFWVIQ